MSYYRGILTVNTPRGTYEPELETDSLDAAVQRVLSVHPDCTSMVATFTLAAAPAGPTHTPLDESGQSVGFTMSETVHDRLKRCYHSDELKRILELMTKDVGAESAAYTLRRTAGPGERVLKCCFIWEATSEGWRYWYELANAREGSYERHDR